MPVPAPHDTTIDIDADRFLINGVPSYAGRSFDGVSIEGLLMNARFVQAVFDDLNPETRQLWAYPDGPFDAERNTAEFVAQVPAWRRRQQTWLIVYRLRVYTSLRTPNGVTDTFSARPDNNKQYITAAAAIVSATTSTRKTPRNIQTCVQWVCSVRGKAELK